MTANPFDTPSAIRYERAKTAMNREPNTIPEQELLSRIICGDMIGYETMFLRYYPTFFAFVRGMTKESALAEDITQNVFMKVWLNREKLDSTKSLKNYLFVLAKHEVYNHFRSKMRYSVPLGDVLASIEHGVMVGTRHGNETEDRIALTDTAAIIESIVDKMPPRRQRVFRMSRGENMPSSEIASELNLSVRTVEKHLELAVRELRTYLNIISMLALFWNLLP
jgi:RNA polymerase sigma-70 factor (ECF subfamily)